MLLAVMLLFAFTPIGFIQIGPIAATLVHIPVIIGVLTEGLGTGIFLGVAFGVISMVRAFVAPTITSFLFMNPLIAIVPRVLIPLIAWAVRALMLRTFEKARFEARFGASAADAIGAFAGSLTNTVLVLSLIWLIYASRYAEALDIAQGGVAAALAATAVMNGLPEAVVAAVSVPAVSGALLLAKRRSAR
jgi:uncharacterized membrane protein